MLANISIICFSCRAGRCTNGNYTKGITGMQFIMTKSEFKAVDKGNKR